MSGLGETHCVFLRGVMPTGKNKVPMADLRQALEAEGFTEVRTYIQSGNALVRSPLTAAQVEAAVHQAIRERIGSDLAIVVRSPAELQAILDANPFPASARERTYFTLLQTSPNASLVSAFLATDFGQDQLVYDGNCLYTCYATRLSDSKFQNNLYEKKLKVAATTRNMNTLEAMIRLAG